VGLGSHTVVDEVRVEWPNGALQRATAVPADQIVRLVEPSAPSLDGRPSYQPGVDAGVYLWREPSDGSYHVRASGDATAPTFTVSLVAVGPVQILGAPGLEAGDAISGTPNGFALTAHVASDEDGVDFRLPSGAVALVATARNGRAESAESHVGASGAPPSGWIETRPRSRAAAVPGREDLASSGARQHRRGAGRRRRPAQGLALFLPLLGATPSASRPTTGWPPAVPRGGVGQGGADADGIDADAPGRFLRARRALFRPIDR
jgi:hypothetical protein